LPRKAAEEMDKMRGHDVVYYEDTIGVEVPLTCYDKTGCAIQADSDFISGLNDTELLGILRWFERNSSDISAIESVAMSEGYSKWFAHVAELAASDGELAAIAHDTLEQYQRGARAFNIVHKRPPRSGYVYLVGSEIEGSFKIGMTTRDPTIRLAEFVPQMPFKCELLLYIESDDPARLEAQLHERFNSKRLRGEWFALDEQDVETLLDMATWKAGIFHEYA
jgi:hypothetical protein